MIGERPSPAYSVSLRGPFVEELRSLKRKHPDLPRRVRQKLELLCNDPIGLSHRLQNAPLCFKCRVGRDFRLIFILQGPSLIPVMIYAKNVVEDVQASKLFAAIEAITDVLEG